MKYFINFLHVIILAFCVFTIKFQIDKQEELFLKYEDALDDVHQFKRLLNACTKTY